MKSGKEHNSLL